jgi:hypothetical protein
LKLQISHRHSPEEKTMSENLQEYCDLRGVHPRVDRQAGVIRGVKILGLRSRNGRLYLPQALAGAVPLYEEAKVNVNHPKGAPHVPRDYQDRIGAIRHVRLVPGEGLFADLYFNPKHALAEQLVWDAEHAPENVGFSHNVQAQTVRRGDELVVEAITQVHSVDLVADPATTRGLYESAAERCPAPGDPDAATTATPTAAPSGELPLFSAAPTLATATVDDLARFRPDLVAALCRQRDAELAELRARLEEQRLTATAQERREVLLRLLSEFALPLPDATDPWAAVVASPRFVEAVLAAPNEAAMRAMVEERAKLVQRLLGANGLTPSPARPLARDQLAFSPPAQDTKSFVAAIT